MVTLIADVVRVLDEHRIPFAVIGAEALSFYGLTRATLDFDVLTTDRRVLAADLWSQFGSEAEIRRGDHDDPLAGVVRFRRASVVVDVVVAWQRFAAEIVERAPFETVRGMRMRVVQKVDLILLKLYAGGAKDAWDITEVLSHDPDVAVEVEARLPALPPDARELWNRIRA